MGKMKEIFLQEREENSHIDDEYFYQRHQEERHLKSILITKNIIEYNLDTHYKEDKTIKELETLNESEHQNFYQWYQKKYNHQTTSQHQE